MEYYMQANSTSRINHEMEWTNNEWVNWMRTQQNIRISIEL